MIAAGGRSERQGPPAVDRLKKLLAALEDRRRIILAGHVDRQRLALGAHEGAVQERLRAWQVADFGCRLWRRDPTLWSPTPVPELADRLGWLTLPEVMHEHLGDLTAFAEEVRAEGIVYAVLLGMGGSSLAPEVLQRTFGFRLRYTL